MAKNESPTIIEPTTSSGSPLPSIPSLSPHTSSSSDSPESSRPNSQGSSVTSRSVSPSSIPKSVPVVSSQPRPENTSASHSRRQRSPPGSVQSAPAGSPGTSRENKTPWLHRLGSLIPRRNRFANAVGVISLGLTLIGFIFFEERTYKLEILAALNEAIGTCGQLNSTQIRLGPNCKKLMSNDTADVTLPRYKTMKWTWNAALQAGSRLLKKDFTKRYEFTPCSAGNDLLDTCGQLKSTGIELGPICRKLLSNDTMDVTFSACSHWRRIWNVASRACSKLFMDDFTTRSTLPKDGLGDDAVDWSFSKFSSVAIVLASTVMMGCMSLIVFRRYWRTEEVFTSPVRSDWQLIRHHQEGPERESGEVHRIIRRNPEDDHPLGQLRQHIRSSQPNAVENPTGEPKWQSHKNSEDTLVSPWKDTKWGTSKVSLTNDTSDEKHDNLIELETGGRDKTFFDPETGEFIHLTPWKSTGDEEFHGLEPNRKGSIKRAFAQMTLGATGWAGGKNIDDQLAEELQANSRGEEKKESNPQEPGDCATRSSTNMAPSRKPMIA